MKDRFSSRARFLVLRVSLAAVLLGFTGACVEAKPAKLLDIADTIAASPILTKFAALVQASDMTTFLSSRGPFTLFVPTDAAFARLSPDQLAALLQPQNQERLQHVLLFHLVNGKGYYARDLVALPQLISCEGNPLTLHKSRSGTQLVLKARIVRADIKCLNGLIHEIDTVLMPPESSLPPLLPPPSPSTNSAPLVPAETPAMSPN